MQLLPIFLELLQEQEIQGRWVFEILMLEATMTCPKCRSTAIDEDKVCVCRKCDHVFWHPDLNMEEK